MGLHLKFILSARGSDPMTARLKSDPTVLRDILRWLAERRLVEDCGVTWLSLVTSDSQVFRREDYASLEALLEHLDEACSDFPIRILNVGGLHAGPGFPNPFTDYAPGEASLSGWLSVRVVAAATPTARSFEMELSEVDFIDSPPVTPVEDFDEHLESVLGVRPQAGCLSVEAQDDSL